MRTVLRLEHLFLAAAAVALVYNVWAVHDARVDLRTILDAGRNGLLKMSAKAAAARELRRAAGQGLLLIAGLSALTINQPPEPARSSVGRLIARGIVVGFQLLLAWGARQDRQARRAMMDYDTQRNADQLESAEIDIDRRQE